MKIKSTVYILLLFILSCFQDVVMCQDKYINPDSISFVILYNEVSLNDSLISDQGFSCLVECGGSACLFDAGRIPETLKRNAETLGADYSKIDRIFISHLHSDHVGELPGIISKCNKPILYLPFSYPKTQTEEGQRYVVESIEKAKPNVSEVIQKKESFKIGDYFHSTGMFEEQTYEQALIITTTKGLIILVGCSHPGIIEIVRRAKSLMKQDVYFIMGGFHLAVTDSERVKSIANELKGLTKFVAPCHCTGDKAQQIFKEIFKEDYIEIKTGLRFKLNERSLK